MTQSGASTRSKKPKKKVSRVSRGEASLCLRGRVWWYKAPDGTSRSTEKKIKSEAIEWKQKFLGERSNSEGRPPTARSRTTVTVNKVLDDYLSYLTLKGRKSVQVITMVFKASIRPAFGDRQPASLTTLDFERYREEREKDVDPVTVNRDFAYLRAALNNGMLRQTPRKVESVPNLPMADESHNVRTGFVEVVGYLVAGWSKA